MSRLRELRERTLRSIPKIVGGDTLRASGKVGVAAMYTELLYLPNYRNNDFFAVIGKFAEGEPEVSVCLGRPRFSEGGIIPPC